MERYQVVLAAMAAGGPRASFNPVQVQKNLFLIDREIPDWIDGPHFNFEPYDYGPFDKAVYEALDSLFEEEQVSIDRTSRHRKYSLTGSGFDRGTAVLGELPEPVVRYMMEVARWVRFLTFGQLLASIYRHYPDMAVESMVPNMASRYPRVSRLFPIPSFSSGMARTFDFMGTLDEYRPGWGDSRRDALAIHGDWAAVGNDLEVAMGSCFRKRPHES